MLNFLHGYDPKLWQGYKKHGLIREGDGIKFPQHFLTPDQFRFNNLAAKDGELYRIVKEEKRPFYIDRLQGGSVIYEYDYDEELLNEYRSILGEKFLGFQMHEWLSNYKSDQRKCNEVPIDEWTEENITAAIKKVFPCKNLLLEAMTMEEMIHYGKVTSAKQLYDNMTEIYKKRVAKYKDLVPCDSGYPMYPFEAENGARMIMPEIGAAGYEGIILMMSYARAVCAAYGIKLGAYYEPWGGEPFAVCTYFPESKNEWFIRDPEEFPFKFAGPGGGSSRSAQWRVYLYAYLSGAEYISEEWGTFNTFADEECNVLSEYGAVKKRFIDFMEKYPDVGEKLAPVAVVISNSLPTYVVGPKNAYSGDAYDELYGFPLPPDEAEKMINVRSNIAKIFYRHEMRYGNERTGLINMTVPDAVDMLNYKDGKALSKYEYLVDLTNEPELFKDKSNLISADEVEEKLKQLLPLRVDGGLHHIINKKIGGGFYLTIFNNDGIERSVARGEIRLPEAERTVKISMNSGFEARELKMLEGDGRLERRDGVYYTTIPAGGWMFMEF